jgi:DNA-binding MarR family transcriptional regulator
MTTKTMNSNVDGSICHCAMLRKAMRRVSQLYDEALGQGGMKITQRSILAQIERSEPTTVGSLATEMVMDPGALAHTLRPLERDGFVVIEVDPTDRRHRLIRLTSKGRTKLVETEVLWRKAQVGFETAFGGAESAALQRMLTGLLSDDFRRVFENGLVTEKRNGMSLR